MSDDQQGKSGDFRSLLKEVPFPGNVFALFGIVLGLGAVATRSLSLGLGGAALFFFGTSWYFFATSFAGAVWYDDDYPSWWETRDKLRLFWGCVFFVLACACGWLLYGTAPIRHLLGGPLHPF